MSFGVDSQAAFTIDVMRMPVEGTPQVKTLKTEDVNQLLMSPITSWKDTVDQLRGAPRDNVRTDYTKRTMLGQGDPFMVPFVSGLENYDKQYLKSVWTDTPKKGGHGRTIIAQNLKVQILDSELDPSIAQRETILPTETVIFVGDIHSSYHSFIEIINDLVTRGVLKDDLTIHPEYWLVFLGDIFDRGTYGLDILNIIFQIKNKSFARVIVLNGNHEDLAIYAGNGTGREIDTQLPDVDHRWLIHKLVTRFPTVLYLEYGQNRFIQACHGGIEPDHDPTDITILSRSDTRFQFHGFDGEEEESELVFRGLRWTDFNVNEPAIGKTPNRGLVYGIDATNAWMEEHSIAGIIRGHQDSHNLSVLPRRTKMPLHYHTHWQNSDSGLWIPTSKIPREPEDPTSFHRIPLVNVFEAFSVVTTSSAVAPRELPYHSYLELKVDDAHKIAATDALKRIPKEQLTSATKISAEDVEYLKSGQTAPGQKKTDDYCLIQELFYKLGADFDEKDAPLLPLYELLSWDPFAPKT